MPQPLSVFGCVVKAKYIVYTSKHSFPEKRCLFVLFFLRSTSVCPVPATVVPSEQINDPSVSGLEKCFDPKCNEKTDSGSCDGIVGCYWCIRDKNDAPLSNKYCADINACYGGKEGTRAPGSSDAPKDPDDDDDDDDKGGMSDGVIAAIVIGVIVATAVAVCIVVQCSNRKRVPSPPSPAVQASAPPYNPAWHRVDASAFYNLGQNC